VRPTPGWYAPRPWSTTFTPTAWIGTSRPFFLKFCTYFPYNAKLCLNGHEYLKRQLTNRRIGYEALDSGILSYDERSGHVILALALFESTMGTFSCLANCSTCAMKSLVDRIHHYRFAVQ
jgi:hypothetical protein